MTRTRWVLAAVLCCVPVRTGVHFARRSGRTRFDSTTAEYKRRQNHRQAARYADPESCAECHAEIARTYSQTGMGRSFSRVLHRTRLRAKRSAGKPIAPGQPLPQAFRALLHDRRARRQSFINAAINSASMARKPMASKSRLITSSVPVNHARTFLHRNSQGQLVQLPVSWYAERGGYWAMSPGYDRPAHLDFRRVIDAGCMSCHNGYPPAPDGAEPSGGQRAAEEFPDSLPNGIDCQRCHGPGQRHIDAIQARDLEAARRSIVNPATLDRDRQLETCMQCHLEPTSSPLPFQIRRYDRAAFSYTPGQALGDYFIYFDHAPGSGRDDKFEIAGDAYRLRKSACFQRSQMTCVTCHNPHDIPRGAKAVQHYVAVCQQLPSADARQRSAESRRRETGRDVHRVSHAEAAHRRCCARRHDRSLHSTATAGRRSPCAAQGGRQL